MSTQRLAYWPAVRQAIDRFHGTGMAHCVILASEGWDDNGPVPPYFYVTTRDDLNLDTLSWLGDRVLVVVGS